MSGVFGTAGPLPPADFGMRALPVIELNLAAVSLYRIHQSVFSPLFFNRRSVTTQVYRFDAPGDEFGVLYAAPTLSACLFETIIRNRFEGATLPLTVDYATLFNRSVSSIGLGVARLLRLADFTQTLAPLGGNAHILSVPDYAVPNAWSLAVYSHPARLDGIYFRSRYSNEPCVALFDRVELVIRGAPTPLLHMPGLEDFLDRYQIFVM